MHRLLASLIILLCCFMTFGSASGATLYTYTNAGNNGFWNVAGTWTTDPSGLSLTGSAVPGNGDVVYILNGFTVNLNANVATTSLTININNGGALDLSTFTMATVSTLSGSGTLRIKSGYFPTITTNAFVSSAASGATVEYYDFDGNLPGSVNYPNLTFTNTTATNHFISFSNATAYTQNISGSLVTQATGIGTLLVSLGTQDTNVITTTISGNVTIGANTTWGIGVFNATHAVSVAGNMTNNGTVQFSNGAQYSATNTFGASSLTFTGATDNTLACNGITNLNTLSVNKGSSSTNILSVTSTNTANLNLYSNGQLLTVTNGTLRLGSNITITRFYGGSVVNYDVGSSSTSPMFWVDGATVNSGNSALVIYGKFRITAGSFTSTGGEGSVIREDGQYLIDGGTFTTEKFRPSSTNPYHRGSFIMTGGVFNATGTLSDINYARFSIPYQDQVFIMTGGTINVSNAVTGISGGIHIGCNAANYNVTGGTFNAIISNNAVFGIASTAPFYNLNVSKTGGTGTSRLVGIGALAGSVTAAQPLKVLNNFTINATNTPVFDANGLAVSIGKDFTINTGATYTPNSNTTTFNGTGDQTFSNSGTITTGLYNLTISKPSGTVTFAGSAATFTITQTLTLAGGIMNDGGKTIQVAGNISNNAVHTGTGNITLNGSATQTLSGNGDGVYGNVILNNASVPGARATSGLAISGVLTLAGVTNSLFDIQQNELALTSTSAAALITTGNPFSATKMIRTLGLQSDGGIRKTYNDLSPFTYAFGSTGNYTPATLQLTAAPATYGTITMKPVNARNSFAGNTNNLTYYWKVVSAGFTGIPATAVSSTFHYVESSVAPAGDDVNYVPGRYNPTSWTVISDLTKVDDAANIISFTGVGYIDGEYTAGVPASFGTVKIFYSKRNGDWSNVTAGTTPWSNVSHSGPDATTSPVVGDYVYIGDGSTFNHAITITASGQVSGGLEISAGSSLDVGITTGHNFGTFENTQITGSGTLRISSSGPVAEFPAGDFGNFIRAAGGTVEYYTTGQDFTIPLTGSAPTNLPLISYKNLTIKPGTGNYVAMPDQNMRIYGDLTVQGTSATGIARLNAATAQTLTVNGNIIVTSGDLQFQNGTAQTIALDGNINVASAGLFTLAGTGTAVTNVLDITGNIVNNGVLDLANGSYICNTTFVGTSNVSITGTGATTDFNILTVSKGTSLTPVLEVNATAFTLSSATTPLVLNDGTFRLTSAQTVTFANGVDFNIPSTARLSANGGTLQLTGADDVDLLLSGNLEVLAGTVNIGNLTNYNSIEYAATGQPTINASGGTLNVGGKIRRSATSIQGALQYFQSGTSIVSVGNSSFVSGVTPASILTRGVFEILNSGSSFNMSGGTLRVLRALGGSTIAELYLQPSTNSVSGGTIEVGTGLTSQIIDINTTSPVFNVSVAGTTNTARLETNPLTIRGSLTIAATDVFQANSLNVSIGANFTNLNTTATTGANTGGYRAGSTSQTTTISSSTLNQTITGAAGNLTNFGNLAINNTFPGGTVTLATNSNLRVHGTLTMTSGTIAGADNTITALGTVFNSTTQTNTAGGSITLGGTTNQFVAGNGNGRFGNVILNNTAASDPGATFGASQEITGTLNFISGTLNIGPYGLELSNPSLTTITGATSARYIITSGNLSDAGITKTFAAGVVAGNFIYPIGVSGKYTPANYTLTSGGLGGTITIRPVNSKHPSATGPGTAFINYYWSVTNSVIILTTLTHTYTYAAADEAGTVTDYRDARFKGGAWTVGITAGNPNTTTRVITFTNTDVQGDYTAGEATAFVNPTTYTSIASGDWESDLTVWDIDPPGTNLGPPQGSFVIISEGHTVTMTDNSKRIATLEIRGRLHLGNTAGHDFGTVSTSGAGLRILQIQSTNFPSGDFSAFTAAGGGTVEYDGALTLPTQNTYNNLTFTSAGVKRLANADLTINGNFNVLAGTVTNAINNRSIYLASGTGDFTNNAIFIAGNGPIIVGHDLINSGASVTFTAGNGASGLRVARNFTNSAGATFTAGTDSIGVRGTFNNSSTFTANSGAIRVTGNFNNTNGTYTGSSGILSVTASLTNNSVFGAGTGATTVGGSFLNSGASAVYTANSNILTVGGNVTHSSGSVFNAGTGSLLISGNWSNTSTFNAGTGSVTFEKASAQTLTGPTTFYNLTRSNGGSLTLANPIIVSNLLTLTSGNIITGTNTVNLTNTALQPVTGYSNNSFVDGRLTISYPNTSGANRFYPVGKGSIYRPVAIQQTAASTSPVVRVEVINTPPSGSYPATVGSLSPARYFAVDQLSGTMNSPTVELHFNTNGAQDEFITVPGNVRVLRSTAGTGPWTDEGGSGVFSPASPSGYATSGVTSISTPTFFTLSGDTPLPITLQYFNAALINGVVELNWATVSEKNNAFFTIERSGTELQFDSIASLKGAGNSNLFLQYQVLDFNPLPDVSYYRLKQTDYDGKFTYSDVVRISNSNNGTSDLVLFPNPVEVSKPVYLRMDNQHDANAFVVITDVTGRVYFSGKVDLASKVDINGLDLKFKLESGVYVITVASGGFKARKKFIVY